MGKPQMSWSTAPNVYNMVGGTWSPFSPAPQQHVTNSFKQMMLHYWLIFSLTKNLSRQFQVVENLYLS